MGLTISELKHTSILRFNRICAFFSIMIAQGFLLSRDSKVIRHLKSILLSQESHKCFLYYYLSALNYDFTQSSFRLLRVDFTQQLTDIQAVTYNSLNEILL